MVLLVVWAIASGLLALFPDDPADMPQHVAGPVHLILAFLAFLAVLAGTILALQLAWLVLAIAQLTRATDPRKPVPHPSEAS